MRTKNTQFDQEYGMQKEISNSAPYENSQNSTYYRENNLLHAAANILAWLVILRSFSSKLSLEKVRSLLEEEIKKFDRKIQDLGYDTHTFLAARYCLFTALDEAILTTSWESDCGWAEESLLCKYYKETSGGERFYTVLETLGEKPEKNIDLLELMYVILNLGFKGKLYNEGNVVREATQYQLFQKISSYLVDPHTPLCFFMRKPPIIKEKSFSFPLWSGFAVFFACFLMSESLCEYKAYELEQPVLKILNALQAK